MTPTKERIEQAAARKYDSEWARRGFDAAGRAEWDVRRTVTFAATGETYTISLGSRASQGWRDEGFSVDEAYEWAAAGVPDAEVASFLRGRGVTPVVAAERLRAKGRTAA